ncbi:MAG: diguanylate cyclase [bacterium]|nr:diguanylate cyclase [bacterium]
MGLLEKALEYKKEINRKGHETLIDMIKGPAETEIIDEELHSSEGEIGEEEAVDADVEKEMDEEPEGIIDEVPDVLEETDNLDGIVEEEGEEEEDEDDILDDLFELPEDDDHSPAEVLKEQKGDAVSADAELPSEDAIVKEGVGEIRPLAEEELDPFGPEDEPVIPKEKAAAAGDDNEVSLEETVEDAVEIEEIVEPQEELSLLDIPDIDEEIEKGEDQPEEKIILEEEPKDDLQENLKEEESTSPATREVEEDEIDDLPENFQDFTVLYEMVKDISKAETKDELYDVILFSITGQIGCSSSSIMVASHEDDNRWIVAGSIGIKVRENLLFNPFEGILKHLKRKIIDIETYKNDPECIDQYDQLISIDTRLLAPIIYKKKLIGALILGEKIAEEDYSEEDEDFILSVSSASAAMFNKIDTIERQNKENQRYKSDLEFYVHLNNLHKDIIRNASLKGIKEIIAGELENLGVECFSIFISNERNDKFVPLIVEKEDSLSIKESNFYIDHKNPFFDFVKELKDTQRIEGFSRLEAVKSAFNDSLLEKMSIFWLYPFRLGNQLIGFINIFRIRDGNIDDEIDVKLKRFSRMLFSSVMSIRSRDPEENRYIDNIEIIFKRINSELLNAKSLNIPLTLVLFSIKNFKRYGNLFGSEKSLDLIISFVEIIKSRLSDEDFSARFDRNKILVVLPGKDKKFAVPLANAVKNEIMQGFKKKEMQLLITFLMAEFPEDGDDLNSLLDGID